MTEFVRVLLDVGRSLGFGAVVGFLFGLFRFPLPAPGTLAGVAGVVGVFLGWYIAEQIFNPGGGE